MKTNDIKKGARVVLTNGWAATIEDDVRGNIRMATVEGTVTEMGSIYAWDIARVVAIDGAPCDHVVQLTAGQIRTRASIRRAAS